jgi:hypothetical protein
VIQRRTLAAIHQLRGAVGFASVSVDTYIAAMSVPAVGLNVDFA